MWAVAICVWLASAAFSQWIGSTLFMFGALNSPTPQVRMLIWAPVVALGGLAAVAVVRRKAVWLPAVLFLSPAVQAVALLLAKLDPVT